MKLKSKVSSIILSIAFSGVVPSLVFSQTVFRSGMAGCITGNYSLIGADFKCTIYRIISLINLLIPIMFGSALIVFFWGLSKFILNSGSPAEVTKGKSYMIWGVLALFVLVSVRAIIGILATNLEIGNTGVIPQFKQL